MLSCFPSYRRSLFRIAAAILLIFATFGTKAQPAARHSGDAIAPIRIEGIGRGTVPLSGPWQFHVGDDMRWADPTFDSSSWEQLSAEKPWGKQGHANLTGFAWYRCRLELPSTSGVPLQFSILISRIQDAYEIYWNGKLVGRNGKLPPGPVRYLSQPDQVFPLGEAREGVLAVRVWKAPLLSDDSGGAGGFGTAPLIGEAEAIATARDADEFEWLRRQLFLFGVNLLCGTIAILSFLLWVRTPSRWILFWTAAFAIGAPARLLLLRVHLGVPYVLAMGAAQPLVAMQDLSLWFLLLWLLSLHQDQRLRRFTRILASIYMLNAVVDGVLVALSWQPEWIRFAQISDAISTGIGLILEAYPLVLLVFALKRRRNLDTTSLLVGVLALLDEILILLADLIKQGRQFTKWEIADNIDAPLFSLGSTGVSIAAIAGTFLFLAIMYAVYHSIREEQRRRDALERERAALLHESERIRHQADHDGLTGLRNRRAIMEQLVQEMHRSMREQTPLSVVMIDVDHFKKINDGHGHMAGDMVLRQISTVFTRSLRSYDAVGRYGGEEFLLILPNCGLEDGLARAEQLRAAVAAEPFMDGETRVAVTASLGVCCSFGKEGDVDAVIRAVDAALYQAKHSGRNCVVRAETVSDISGLQNGHPAIAGDIATSPESFHGE